MKTNLRLLLSGIFFCGALFFSNNAIGQINYSESFDSDYDWEVFDFYEDEEWEYGIPCAGDDAMVANLYDGIFGGYVAEMISPSIGTSEGGFVTLSYQYKLLNYDSTLPTEPTENAGDWGFFTFAYATSPDGPFTVIETVKPDNHIESADCATRTVVFVPPAGEEIYIQVYAEIDDLSNDFLVYIDEIELVETAAEDCDGAPSVATAVASVDEACLNTEIALSLSSPYLMSGISYQWQSSSNGTDFADVETGGNESTYLTTQMADTWYRVIATCDATDDSTASTPVMVESNGQLCYCEIEFSGGVEPITLVQFAGIDNSSDAEVDGTPGVEDFTDLEPAEVTLGETYEITIKGNTAGEYLNSFAVYFDFNHNGSFSDEGERFELGDIDFSDGEDEVELTGELTIPDDVLEGTTQMRVLKHYYYEDSDFPAYLDEPCGDQNNEYGQAEDYLVNISAPAVPAILDYYNLQWPATITINEGGSDTVYAQAWEPDVTPGAGAGEGVMAWIAVNDADTDPATWDADVWVEAEYNASATANNDEFMLEIGSGLEPGTYYYAARWQLEDGPYTYGGFQGAWNGDDVVNGVLTVNCAIIDEPEVEMTTQTFCGEAEAHDLEAEETVEDGELVWYDAETGGNVLGEDDELQDGEMYYVAQLVGGCESARVGITVEVSVTAEVEAESPQVFTGEAPLTVELYEDVEVTAEGAITWYASEKDAEEGENALAAPAAISEAGTYYVTQVIAGCESAPTPVEIQMVLGNEYFSSDKFSYYPNPVESTLTLAYTDTITQIDVFNMLGQKITSLSNDSSLFEFDMSGIAAGSYLVKVTSGDKTHTVKVFKK